MVSEPIRRFSSQDDPWIETASRRIESLTMPRWALGRVCDLMVEVVRIQRSEAPSVEPVACVVLAGDHGVTAEGVSCFPSDVTGQMIGNFLAGGAAISVLTNLHGAPLYVVDMGCASAAVSNPPPNYLAVRLGPGTANFAKGPAMSLEMAERAMSEGRTLLDRFSIGPELRTLIPGEMGIGNTTSASALAALLLDRDPTELVGLGTGVDEQHHARKIHVVREAAERYAALRSDPIGALAAVGGFEIAGMVGMMLQAAERRTVVFLDGFIASVAALVADRIDNRVRETLIASHLSCEPGHRWVLEALGVTSILELGMRLGEAGGAMICWPILKAAVALYCGMATFDQANVSDKVE